MKKCPVCAEEIQDEAIKCKHCGEILPHPGQRPMRIANICPRCSKEYDDTWKTCLSCSVPLVKKEVEIETTTKKCPKCGTVNKLDAFRCKNESCTELFSSIPDGSYINVSGTCLTCFRCGFKGAPSDFKDAYSDSTCCCLAMIMLLPAILYYFFRQGKKICPKCKAVF